MSHSRIRLVRGDTAPPLVQVVVDSLGRALDLSASDTYVRMRFRQEGSAELRANILATKLSGTVLADDTVVDLTGLPGAGGRVQFTWPAEALTGDAGNYEGEIYVEYGDGTVYTQYERLKFKLRGDFAGDAVVADPSLLSGMALSTLSNVSSDAFRAKAEASGALGPMVVPLFATLSTVTVPDGVDAIYTLGHTEAAKGAAMYRLDSDQVSSTASRWRGQTQNGRWFILDEDEPSFEQFGALGQTDHLNPVTDDTDAIVAGAVAWSNQTGGWVRGNGVIYNVRDTIELTYGRIKGVGSTNTGNGALATTQLLFSHLGTKSAIMTTLEGTAKLAVIEGMNLRANSWDPVTGCIGYGMEIGSRVIGRDLVVNSFGKSGLFLHGAAAGGGPYFSRFESCRFLYSKEHGAVVGTGANAVTFVDCEWKWNGAPSFGVAPTVAGVYDGLHVDHEGDGNPGSAYQSYWPEGLTVIGGDASYNSRYGYNFQSVRSTGSLMPAYAELNLSADGYEARFGLNVQHVEATFGALSGGYASVKVSEIYHEYLPTVVIKVGGYSLGVFNPGRAVSVLDYIPPAYRAMAVAGTFTAADATSYVQAAIDTGKNVDMCGLTLMCAGLTMANNQQEMISTGGTANIFKWAAGPILTISGNDVVVRNVTFRGQAATLPGDNVVVTGERPTFDNSGSLDAAGRALKAAKNLVRIYGSNPKWQTADTTTSGYDIEIGTSGTATLYHHLQDVYTGQSTGGLLLVDVGSQTVVGGQFGKYTVQAGTSPAGSNGGKCLGSRVLGAITLGLPGAKMAACDISGVNLTFGTSTSGCSVDESNTFASGFTVTNNGNGNNYIARNVSAGSYPTIKYGAAANAVELGFDPGLALRVSTAVIVPNATAIGARNQAGTADISVAYVSGAANNVFLGYGGSTSATIVQGGSGNVLFDVSGVRYGAISGTAFSPNADNAKDLGTTALRFRAAYAYTVDAATEYRIGGTKVVGARGAAIADATVAAAAPTKAEFDALVGTVNEILSRIRASTGHGLIT